jgi:hypothetical protein
MAKMCDIAGFVPRPLVPVSTQRLPYASATTLWMRSNTRAARIRQLGALML